MFCFAQQPTQVDGYGFMGDITKYSHYYYDSNFTKYSWKTIYHDWFAENELWQRFMDAGVLNMFTREDDDDRAPAPPQPQGANQTGINLM